MEIEIILAVELCHSENKYTIRVVESKHMIRIKLFTPLFTFLHSFFYIYYFFNMQYVKFYLNYFTL